LNATKAYNPIPTQQAIPIWNDLAGRNSAHLTHAHNPCLFSFYINFLQINVWYCILFSGGQAIGLLPLTGTKKYFYSMPHLSYGGIMWLCDPPEDEGSVFRHVIQWIQSDQPTSGFYEIYLDKLTKKVDNQDMETYPKLILRTLAPQLEHFHTGKSIYWMKLMPSLSEQDKLYKANLRRKIRAAGRKSVEVIVGGQALLHDFFGVYRNNLHRLGSPPLPIDFFRQILNACPTNEAMIAVAYYQGKPIGGGFWMAYKGFVENTHFATLAKYNSLYTAYALHGKMVEQAINQGAHTYSFGRSSSGSSVEKFKTQWPVEVIPLYLNSTHPIHHQEPGIRNLLSNIWKRLPSLITNWVGPVIAKRIY